MLKFFFSRRQGDVGIGEPLTPAWRRDPLLHPQLQDMSQRQLADLPFPHPPLPADTPLQAPGDRVSCD